jgi:hypothetical protein
MLFDFIYFILFYGGTVAPFLSTVAGAIFLRRLNRDYKYVWFFVLVGFITQLSLLLIIIFKENGYNFYLIPFYGLSVYIIFTLLYAKFFKLKKPIYLWIVTAIISVILILEGVIASINQDPTTFLSFGKIFSVLMIIFYCVIYIIKSIYDKTKEINSQRVELSFIFLFYFSFTLIIDVSMNFLMNSKIIFIKHFLLIHMAINILLYIILAFKIWKHGKNRKSLHLG